MDTASVTIIFVLLELSKRLGEALKKPPLYKILYISIGLIACSAIISIVGTSETVGDKIADMLKTLSMAFRFLASVIAVVILINYWKWLFNQLNK